MAQYDNPSNTLRDLILSSLFLDMKIKLKDAPSAEEHQRIWAREILSGTPANVVVKNGKVVEISPGMKEADELEAMMTRLMT